MASILDLFRSTPAAPAPAPTTQQPTTQPQNTTEQPTQQNTAPTQPTQNTGESTAAPLDQFTKLWETDDNSGGSSDQSLFGTVDPKKVFEAARGANFASAVTPEMLQAIAGGGEGAVAALQQALNAATQAVFAQSTLASTKLIEQGVAKAMSKYDQELPGLVKRHAASDSLQGENPALSNPAAAPIIKAIQAQLSLKFPDATASQLTALAKDYLNNFADIVKPAPKKEEPKPAAGEIDWLNWANQ